MYKFRNEEKKGGQGARNWGGVQDEIEIGANEVAAEVAAPSDVVESQEEQVVEPTVREMTLEEYEKQRAEKQANMELTANKRVVEVDDELKAKFVVLDKKTKESFTPKSKKAKKKSGQKKTVETLEVSFTMDGSNSGRGNRGGNRGGRGNSRGGRGGKGRGGKGERGPKLDDENFPSL